MRQAFICDAIRTPFGRYAPCTMCIGVGLGIAVILERILFAS